VNAIAPIGHNAPPEPFDAFKLHIDDLYSEAANFLDGQPIANQAQADTVNVLLNRLRKAEKDGDEARRAEKKPHDDAGAAVQAKWTPLLGRAKLAVQTCKQALAPFLEAQEAAKQRAVEAAQQEARDKAEAARKAIAAPDDLTGQAEHRALQEAAALAGKAATRAEKQKVQVKGGERATSLRTSYRAELTDPKAFGRWLWEHRNADYLEWLTGWAQSESRNGPRGIPGIIVHPERKAV
jgi:hypothetical protein